MEYITSKNICLLVRDIFALTNQKIMEHGVQVGYIISKMLESTALFEEFEVAELSFITFLQNIGGYRIPEFERMLRYGEKDYLPHSMYGYLFMKNLFPVPGYGKVLLYHHMDYDRMENIDYEFKFLSDLIHIADDAYCLWKEQNEAFDYTSLAVYKDKKYSERAYNLLEFAVQSCQVFEKLENGEYKDELDQLMDFVMFRDDEKEQYLKMLMYCTGFCNASLVSDTILCTCICDELAKKMGMSVVERQELYLGAMLHDIGMLMVPKQLMDKQRELSEEEEELLRSHVERAEEVLAFRFLDQRIVDIAVRHHERLDGSGYPEGLKGSHMNEQDKILQVADAACGPYVKGLHQKPKNKEETIRILQREVDKGRLDGKIVHLLTATYDEIMERVKKESAEIFHVYQRIEKQYHAALQKTHN